MVQVCKQHFLLQNAVLFTLLDKYCYIYCTITVHGNTVIYGAYLQFNYFFFYISVLYTYIQFTVTNYGYKTVLVVERNFPNSVSTLTVNFPSSLPLFKLILFKN